MSNPNNSQPKGEVLDVELDHDYDGIKEYDNPLPGWWVRLFQFTVIWAFGYAAYAWVGPGVSAYTAYEEEVAAAEAAAKARAAAAPKRAALSTLLENKEVLALGAQVFAKNCASCHATDGGGIVGPNLTDTYFLHGAKIEDTRRVIHDGVIEKGMLAWGKTLSADEIDAVAVHVFKLRGTTPAAPKAPQGVTADGEAPSGEAAPLAAAPAQGEAAPAEGNAEGNAEGDAAQGKALYATCTACHGAQGEGNVALNAPTIASQEAWYLKRQLKNFKVGVRGTHADDAYGQQMRPMAMMLADDAAIANVAAYISAMPQPAPAKVSASQAEIEKGKGLYATCTACHGANAEGNAALNAPKLATLPAWYIERQLKNFKAGVRGADPKDTYGQQMRPMAMTLADDAAVKAVAAYISSLNK
jgi:cytochrome c553